MRVLWICNILFPEWYVAEGIEPLHIGGWMKSLADALCELDPELELAVASPVLETTEKWRKRRIGRYTFYAMPHRHTRSLYDDRLEEDWRDVRDDFRPEAVHIHGSEGTHALAWVNACGAAGVVVSLQGVISGYARYDSGGLQLRTGTANFLICKLLPRLKGMEMKRLAPFEQELLSKVNHVIGRTDWDRAHTWAINPTATYHHCNENLRPQFYAPAPRWNPEACQRHSIFLSQANYPVKGLHRLLDALPLVLRHYPDTHVYVAGYDILHHPKDSRAKALARHIIGNPYADYLRRQLAQIPRGTVKFTGSLDAEAMAERYRMANVFVCPSSIENSPNSVGEAQLVGVPVVASYVGGTPSMVTDGETGLLYRFEEHEMLAQAICRIFADDALALKLSGTAHAAALKRHDRTTNATATLSIYRQIATK